MILLKQIDPLPGITYGYEQIYETEIEQDSPGTSDFAMLPAFLKPVLVAVFPSGGSCSVQTSSDAIDRIIDGTAVWETWAAGTVNSAKSDIAVGAKAVRLVVSSGSARMVVTQE